MDTTNLRTGVSPDRRGPIDFIDRSPGQVERLQRRVPRDDRRRDQRDHQVGRQRVPRQRRHLLLSNDDWLGNVRPALRLEPGEPDAWPNTSRRPRDKPYQLDPVVDLGGPILRDKRVVLRRLQPQYIDERARRHVHAERRRRRRSRTTASDATSTTTLTTQLTQRHAARSSPASNQRRYGQERDAARRWKRTARARRTRRSSRTRCRTQHVNDFYVGDSPGW